MRKQYHSRIVGPDTLIWDVHELIRATKGLDTFRVPPDEIAEVDENWWYQDPGAQPTPRSLVHHMKLVQKTSLDHPIIFCAEGRLMDGMHRIVKAIMEHRLTIDAVRFATTPSPHFKNVSLDDLPYYDEEV